MKEGEFCTAVWREFQLASRDSLSQSHPSGESLLCPIWAGSIPPRSATCFKQISFFIHIWGRISPMVPVGLPEGKLERKKFLRWPIAPDTAVGLRLQPELTHPFPPTQSILNLPAIPYCLSMIWLLIWWCDPNLHSWGSECLMIIPSSGLSCCRYLFSGPREYQEVSTWKTWVPCVPPSLPHCVKAILSFPATKSYWPL